MGLKSVRNLLTMFCMIMLNNHAEHKYKRKTMMKSFQMFETQEEWDNEVDSTATRLKANGGGDDLAAFGAKLLYERILQRPTCYAEFGVYWFAVKAVLAEYGYHFGETDDEEMRLAYTGKTAAHTLIAAERFKDYYCSHYFQGTLNFILEDDDYREWYLSVEDQT